MSVALSAALVAAQAVGRYEATRQLLIGGALVCHAGPRPEPGGPALYPAVARIPFVAAVGTVSTAGLVLTVPVEGQCLQAGDITWGRIETAAGEWVADFDTADLALDVTSVLPGAFVRLLEGTFR